MGCGCFGEVSATPVGLRSLGRTVVLTAMSAGMIQTPGVTGWSMLTGITWTHAPAAIGGLLVLLALSPEIEEAAARLRYRAPCEQRPLDAGHRAQPPAREQGLAVAREPALGHGTDGQLAGALLAILRLPGAEPLREPVDVVFAIYLSGRHPAVRVALVGIDGQPIKAEPLPDLSPYRPDAREP